MAPTAGAQDHVIGKSALDQAVQQRVSREQADREVILSLLQRQDVRDIAGKAGLSIDKAADGRVHAARKGPAAGCPAGASGSGQSRGGASTITVSTTTIIIVLLLIILIVVIAD